jgi:phosphopantetheinyl transferase
MIKVFFKNFNAEDGSEKPINSEKFVCGVLSYYYGIENAEIARTEKGKPYLVERGEAHFGGSRLQFSLSHTNGWIFVAVARQRVGLDAERVDRKVNYLAIAKKYPLFGEFDFKDAAEFLRVWTVAESNVKRIGGTLREDLPKLRGLGELDNRLAFEGETPAWVKTELVENMYVSVCADEPDEVEFIAL